MNRDFQPSETNAIHSDSLRNRICGRVKLFPVGRLNILPNHIHRFLHKLLFFPILHTEEDNQRASEEFLFFL